MEKETAFYVLAAKLEASCRLYLGSQGREMGRGGRVCVGSGGAWQEALGHVTAGAAGGDGTECFCSSA